MSYWIEHDSGEVLRAVMSDDTPDPLMGGAVIPVDRLYDPWQTLVIDGLPVDFGPQPSRHHVKNAALRAWGLVGITELKVAQDAKWSAIKAERDRRETTGFSYMGKILDSDPRSVQRITGAVQAAQKAIADGADFSIDWTCANNTVLTMNAAQMMAAPVALATYANALHQTARALRDTIYHASATLESVAAVSWPV